MVTQIASPVSSRNPYHLGEGDLYGGQVGAQ
jgi:hypothetical protein